MRYQRGRKEPRRSAAGLDAAWKKIEENLVSDHLSIFEEADLALFRAIRVDDYAAVGRYAGQCLYCEAYGTPKRERRRAIVAGHPLETVRAYLPRNYVAQERDNMPGVEIIGYDDHGWTLDGYVIPRLASALIAAKEV